MNDGWTGTTLGEIAEVVGGGTPKTSVPGYWGGSVPWITPTEVTAKEGRVITTTERTITDEGLARSSANVLPVNTVLLTSRATIGAVALAGVPMATNQGFASLVAGPHVLPEFLMYWCQMNRQRLLALAVGNTFLEVSKGNVRSLRIALPPLAEQRRIVDFLLAVDEQIGGGRELAAGAKAAARAVRREHFRPDQATGQIAAHLFQIDIGRQRAPRHANGPHMVRYLRAANVLDGRLDLTDVKAMNFDPAEQARFSLHPGDVLVTEGCGTLRELGAAAAWHDELADDPVCFQNTLLRVRARPGVSTAEYAEQWARHCYEAGVFASVASGTNIFHIGVRRAQALPLIRVPLSEQQSLVSIAAAFDAVADSANAVGAGTRRLRNGLLADLLSGQRRLPSAYDRLLEAV